MKSFKVVASDSEAASVTTIPAEPIDTSLLSMASIDVMLETVSITETSVTLPVVNPFKVVASDRDAVSVTVTAAEAMETSLVVNPSMEVMLETVSSTFWRVT